MQPMMEHRRSQTEEGWWDEAGRVIRGKKLEMTAEIGLSWKEDGNKLTTYDGAPPVITLHRRPHFHSPLRWSDHLALGT